MSWWTDTFTKNTTSDLDPMQRAVVDKLNFAGDQPATRDDVIKLRVMLQEVLDLLTPASSTIITGPEVMKEFLDLTTRNNNVQSTRILR